MGNLFSNVHTNYINLTYITEDEEDESELVENAEEANLDESAIRKMEPADLVKRLESEKVSTRGHMPELRARLLRLEARKSGLNPHPRGEPAGNKENKAECSDAKDTSLKKRHKKKVPFMETPIRRTVSYVRIHENYLTRCKSVQKSKSYTERVLKDAVEALNKIIPSMTDEEFFDSMEQIKKEINKMD